MHFFCAVNGQIAHPLAKQTKSSVFLKKTVDVRQAD